MFKYIIFVIKCFFTRKIPGFIVFEGIDGSGKSTHLRRLCDFLEKQGKTVFPTCEPTRDLFFGKKIRTELGAQKSKFGPWVMQTLYALDRLHHLFTKVLPQAYEGKVVVSDRYFFSSICYGATENVRIWFPSLLNLLYPRPEHVVYVDVTVKEALKRITTERGQSERFEKEDKLTIARGVYLYLMPFYKACIVSSLLPEEEVAKEIINSLPDHLKQK